MRLVRQLAGLLLGALLITTVSAAGLAAPVPEAAVLEWESHAPEPGFGARSIAFGDGRFVAAGGRSILLSEDGQHWELAHQEPLSRDPSVGAVPGYAIPDLRAVTYADGRFVAVGNPRFLVMTSATGETWDLSHQWKGDNHLQGYIQLVDVTHGGGRFVAVGDQGVDSQSIASTDGVNWLHSDTLPGIALTGVTYDGNRFLAVGGDRDGRGVVMISTDGLDWASVDADLPPLSSVVHSQDRFFAVSHWPSEDGAYLFTSPDGQSWEGSPTPGGMRPNRVTEAGGILFLLGAGLNEPSPLAFSPDGDQWMLAEAPVALTDVAAGEGRLAAAGWTGAILTLSPCPQSLALSPAHPACEAVSVPEGSFPDINGHWARGDITRAVQQGLASGYPDGSFRPNASVTRAEFVKLAVQSRGLTAVAGSGGFGDLEDHWLNRQGYMEAAVGAGLVVASDYGSPPVLRPDQPITRLEVVVIASRVLGRQGANWSLRGAHLPYSDAGQVPYWASGSVAVAHSAGILFGYPDGTFQGGQPITRAEAIVVANRLFDRRGQTDVPVWEGNSWRVETVSGLPADESSWPSDMTAAPDGSVYVLMNNEVWRLPTEGSPMRLYRHPEGQLMAIAAGPDGIYTAGDNRIWKLSETGEAVPWLGGSDALDTGGKAEGIDLSYVQSLCVSSRGDLFVIASAPSRILRVTTDGSVQTMAMEDPGQPGYPTPIDGPAGEATVYLPQGCAVDREDNLYFADVYPGRAIRRMAPDGSISWYAGHKGWIGYQDGTVAEARFGNIGGLAVDDWGNLWVADESHHRVRRVTPDGHVYTVAGSGFEPHPTGNWLDGGHRDGWGPEARLDALSGIALAGGRLYVSQYLNAPLRVISGDVAHYTAPDAAHLEPIAFTSKTQLFNPIPLPNEPSTLPVALYTPVVDLALLVDGVVRYESGRRRRRASLALAGLERRAPRRLSAEALGRSAHGRQARIGPGNRKGRVTRTKMRKGAQSTPP